MSLDLKPVLELDVGSPMRQFRFAPLRLAGGRGFLVVHSSCPSVDPWPPLFKLPTDTLKLTVFGSTGERLWHRDIGPGMIPGIWFCPVFVFDLDGDGTDEIYLITNNAPDHALCPNNLSIECLDARTGELIRKSPWPEVGLQQNLSHIWRNFINGGYSNRAPRLITAQGTYGPMQIQCWDKDFNQLWSRVIDPKKEPGSLGSHMFPILDIDGDGRDELLWGERCLDIDTGRDIWIADRDAWRGHSDIIEPLLDLETGRWKIFTCRESALPAEARGMVMFDDAGQKLWAVLGLGHMHVGWAARLRDDGQHLCYGHDVGTKTDYLFDTEGEAVDLPVSVNRTLPVDFDGDGLHELVYTAKANRGLVVDRHGKELCRLDGKPMPCGKILDLPGEQIVAWPKYDESTCVYIYAWPDATDSPAAMKRYEHPYYLQSQRIMGVGYNWRNLGGL